ncbi:MAG: hypothetical protein HGA70_07725 [Chlorobiaceae bacterium]|nr:hypothetical protein [Chlorobiaceae bacterium]
MKASLKFTTGIILLSSLAMLPGCSGQKSDGTNPTPASSSSSMPRPYEIKSGIVHFKPVIMMGVKVTETLYFDDYGLKEARESVTDSDIMGTKNHEEKVEIRDGNYMISYAIKSIVNGKDETSKEATRTNIGDMRELAAAMGKSMDVNEMKKNMDYREEGPETVAGVTGRKYSVALDKSKPDIRVSGVMYKNIVLKSELAGMSVEASSIEENASVPSDKFAIPAGYTVKDVDLAAEMKNAGGEK